jgi:hypothetical protein
MKHDPAREAKNKVKAERKAEKKAAMEEGEEKEEAGKENERQGQECIDNYRETACQDQWFWPYGTHRDTESWSGEQWTN